MREKLQKFSQVLISALGTIMIVAIIGFILFNIGRSIWKNWQINQKISQVESDINNLQSQNQHLSNLIAYYKTDSFKELEARRKLGYKKTGENVLMISELTPQDQNETQLPQNNNTKQETKTANFIKWWQYVVGR